MHELSITQSILNQALAEAKNHKAKKIKKIKLQIGRGTAIAPECVQFYFDTIKTNTIAKNSILEIEVIPIKLRCPKCKKEISLPSVLSQNSLNTYISENDTLDDFKISCNCKKGVEIVSGQDMVIEYIDVDT